MAIVSIVFLFWGLGDTGESPVPGVSLGSRKAGVRGASSVRTGCLHAGVSEDRTRAGRLASEFLGDRRKFLGTRVRSALRVLGGARASLWV